MRRGPKPERSKAESKPPVPRKSPKGDDARVRELENRPLAEAQEQQKATSEILRVISTARQDLQLVFDTIAQSARRLCEAMQAVVSRYDGELVHLAALDHVIPEGMELARQMFPMPPSRASTHGRVVLDRAVVHIPDVRADAEYSASLARAIHNRSTLGVPMLLDGRVIGVIAVARNEVRPFADSQIALLETFADQAVIAIENARLFTETKEALERQTATAAILRVISSSPTDLQPVFAAIAESAVRLCGGVQGNVVRFDGELVHRVAGFNLDPEGEEALRQYFPRAVGRELAITRAILDGSVVHLPDTLQDADQSREITQATRARAILAVPMLRDGQPIGAISVVRREARPFPGSQIALLTTFADQAVIAIENVRLFNETKEALEQQTATSDILRVIASSPTDLQPVLDAVAERAARLCSADDAVIYSVDGDVRRRVAHFGSIPLSAPAEERLSHRTVAGHAILECRTIHIPDVFEEFARGEYQQTRERERGVTFRTVLITPLLREDVAMGAIMIRRTEVRPFSERQIELVKTFADQAVIAIENVRLFTELQEKNQALTQAHAQVTESLEQQTATSEILQTIAQAQTDVQPVFETIVQNARRLCAAERAFAHRFEGGLLRVVATHNVSPELRAFVEQNPFPLGRHSVMARAGLERRTVHIHDVQADPEVTYGGNFVEPVRTALAVPMLRGEELLGVIMVYRHEVRPFTDSHVALLQTFADQAAIAIENVRLFTELEARTQDLTRSVGELRALGEVGQAISSTLDLQTVLRTIVSRATHLAGMDAGVIYEYDEGREFFEPRATERLEENIVRTLVATPIRKGEGATGRLAEVREPIQVADVRDRAQAFQAREVLVRAGYRAALAVPLVREDRLLGGLTVFRRTPGEFPAETIDLLRTFATQSALAIQNARLFREIEEKSRQLEVASQHKSEFLANMSHELRTPLNAIIGFSEVLSERMFGELNEKQEEYLKDIYASGTHLLSLINDILDLSKIEAGRMELELSDFHLPTALDSALTLVRERAGRRGIALQMNVDNRLGQIQADERKVRQVVLNLLSNAIKFTPEGGRIEVVAVPRDGSVEVSVSDTGVGIAPEDQEAVFEEFRQVGTADKKVEGTGLGLTLCRKFVELHGGKIWVTSQVGVGSTFTFSLPLHNQ